VSVAARRLALWVPVAGYMALIFVGSSMPRLPEVAPGTSDKLLHLIVYAGLGALLVRALAGGWLRTVPVSVAINAFVIATLYGISDEIHQHFVPNREVEALDVIADASGAAIASAALYAWDIIRGRHGL
jgi:VanZ family protein